ncbi:MAG: hypothetical protein JXA89_10820 [Anaerolineae bacterium]|nr:hypothetical protein [Anaerolineae bacterium]
MLYNREPGPYVLVGYSLGGIHIWLFTAHCPDEVVRLVLIDTTTAVHRHAGIGRYAPRLAFTRRAAGDWIEDVL